MARPQFCPSDEQRRMVKSMAGLGTPQEEIASTLQVAPHTLRKHFRQELNLGVIEANAQVANTAYKMATSGKHPIITIFWLKTRNRWNDRPALESSDPVAPPQFHISIEGRQP